MELEKLKTFYFQESYFAYVILYMGLLWITEALPLPVTALVPVVAFPLLGVTPATDISAVYLSVIFYLMNYF